MEIWGGNTLSHKHNSRRESISTSTPASSLASRAAARRGVSPASSEPPGNTHAPGKERMLPARFVISNSPAEFSNNTDEPIRRRGVWNAGFAAFVEERVLEDEEEEGEVEAAC